MLARVFTLLLGFVIAAIICTCPFIRKTRKGILFAHYALLHTAHALEFIDNNELAVGTSPFTILLAASILAMLMEHAITLNEKDSMFNSVYEALPFIALIIVFDSLAILFHQNAFVLGNLLFSTLLLGIISYLKATPRRSTLEIPIEELEKIADGTFFFDLENPLNCLGRHGWLHALLIVSQLVVGLFPFLSSNKFLQSIFVFIECIATWLILVLPVVVGGFIQTMKLVGRHIVEVQLHRRVLEAERKDKEDGQKQRRREELLASVEEIYGDEVVFSELV